jgi:CheY-like chemotaxis protein
MAEDDEDDRDLVRDAFIDARVPGEIRFVADGQDLLDYLRRTEGSRESERPGIVLMDLNMPRKDGREALAEMKADRALCEIPVVVMTTSTDQEDIKGSYSLGASSFITKPATHSALIDVMRDLTDYWFRLVELPR